jgi:hypothetical protein
MVGSGWLKWLCFAVGWQFGGPGLAFMAFIAGYYLEKHWLPNEHSAAEQRSNQDYRIALQEIAVLLHAAITPSMDVQQQQWRYIRQEFRKRYGVQEGDSLYLFARKTQPTSSRIAHAADRLVSLLTLNSRLQVYLMFCRVRKIQSNVSQAELQKILLIGRGLGLSPEEAKVGFQQSQRPYVSTRSVQTSNNKTHYYADLGIPTGADKIQIKKAYRKLVLQYHPDRSGGQANAKKFRAIQEAYDALMEQ